jgi:hypothetical protein
MWIYVIGFVWIVSWNYYFNIVVYNSLEGAEMKYDFTCKRCGAVTEFIVPGVMEKGQELLNHTPCACGCADYVRTENISAPKIQGCTTPARKD